jgi:hypothetical protein
MRSTTLRNNTTTMRQDPAFKTDENGRPCLKASYIMRKDPRAKAAYNALRCRGLSARAAKDEIEHAFQLAFTEVLIAEAFEEGERGELTRDRRKAEIWLSLAEGFAGGEYFPQPAVKTNPELTGEERRPDNTHRRPVVQVIYD